MIRYFAVFCFFFGITPANAQQVSQQDYYVVIGVFSSLAGAEKLTEEANLKTFSAHYARNEEKMNFYVYLFSTSEKKKAKSFLHQIRKETEYKNAHLYRGKLGDIQ